MKKKLVILSLGGAMILGTAIGVSQFNDLTWGGFLTANASLTPSECSHTSIKHYDATNDYFETGHKEYWVCCNCHASFDHEPTAKDDEVIENTTGSNPEETTDGRYAGRKTYIGVTDLCVYNKGQDGSGDKTAPEGFEKVHKIKGTWAANPNSTGNFMEFSQYKSFSFAVATQNGEGSFQFYNPEGNTSLFDTNSKSWTLYEFKDEGNNYFQMYKNGGWANVQLPLDGNLCDYKIKLGSDTFYFTEVRGLLKSKEGIKSKYIKVADYPTSAFSGGTLCTTEMFDLGYGSGMSTVYQKTVAYNKTNMPNVNMSKYTEFMFGIKGIDYSASNVAWVYMNEKTYIPETEVQGNWFICRIIRQENGNWTFKFGKNEVSDIALTNLNELKFKAGATTYAYTPLYAIEKEVEKPVYVKLDYSISADATKNDYSLTELKAVEPNADHSYTIHPAGGKYIKFDTLDISGYTRLYFAAIAKSDTLNIYFPNGKNSKIGLNTAFKFMIDKVIDGVWTITYYDTNGSMMSTTVGAPGDEVNDLATIFNSVKVQDWSSHGLRVTDVFATTFNKFVDEETKTSERLAICPLNLDNVGYGGRVHYEEHTDGYTLAHYEMIAKTRYPLLDINVGDYNKFYFYIDGSYNGQATTYIKFLDGNNSDTKINEPGFGNTGRHEVSIVRSGDKWNLKVDGNTKGSAFSMTNLSSLKMESTYYNISISSIFAE